MIAIFGSIILWTITTWVTLKKLIKKEKEKEKKDLVASKISSINKCLFN
jgi:hypothetical protein